MSHFSMRVFDEVLGRVDSPLSALLDAPHKSAEVPHFETPRTWISLTDELIEFAREQVLSATMNNIKNSDHNKWRPDFSVVPGSVCPICTNPACSWYSLYGSVF